MLELQQQIWDGGGIRMQKKKATAEAEIDREKLNVDMYALNGRVNDLYFGILMLDEQLAQNALLQDELGRNYPSDYSLCGKWNSQSGRSGCCESGAVEYPSEKGGT